MKMELSIVIATVFSQNRDESIKKIINTSLSALDNCTFEIIIVNNGEIKLNNKILDNYKEEISEGKIIIIDEEKPDLTHARNIGVKKSKGKYIFFLDDDIEIEKNYFNLILETFHRNPDCLCVGGKVIVKEKNQIGKFSDPFYYRFLSPPYFPESPTKIKSPFYVAGASMSFRRDVFEKFGLFDESLGRKRGVLLSNEDSEMVMRIPTKNTYIDPQAIVITSIDINKLSNIYFIKRFFWQGISDGVMFSKKTDFPYYDNNELYLKKGLIKILTKELFKLEFNKFLCSSARYIGFSFHSLFVNMLL